MTEQTTKSLNIAFYKRTHAGDTIQDVSRATGLSPMTISRIENGIYSSGYDKLETLARHHGITIDVLLRNDFGALFPTLKTPAVANHTLYEHYAEISAACLKNGLSGEDWVFLQERQRLAGTPYENAVNPNYADDPDAHFDILTFTDDGKPIVVEVKATSGNADKSFYISAPELDKARECIDAGIQYEIHRVYNVDNPEKIGREIISAEELFSKYDIIPCNFKVTRRKR